MGILIKGMEMPSERTMLEVFPDGKVFEIHPNNNARIPTESVAIPVPEHGDLIDRDVILDSEKMFFAPKFQGDHRTNYDTMMGYEIGNMLRDAEVVLERTT